MRRIQRDVAVRGRDVHGVIEQYTRFVKPAFDQFVAPSRKHADIIIPWARCACCLACPRSHPATINSSSSRRTCAVTLS